MAPQSLAMCLRPATPRILTEPVSFGVIDFSKRVSRAELDKADRLWREKRQRNGTAIQVVHKKGAAILETEANKMTLNRASFESDMTRVEGRQYSHLQREHTIATSMPSSSSSSSSSPPPSQSRPQMEQRNRNSPVKSLFFLRKPPQTQVVV